MDHFQAGENLGAIQNGIQAVSPTELPILSWFGGFRAITIPDPGTALRLVAANSILNAMEQNIGGWVESQAAGFHTWPSGFYPVAQMLFDNNPTPTNNSGYFAPCEADTGYRRCSGFQPLVYMLARPVAPTVLTHLKPAQCNLALNVNQTCAFSAYSTTVPDENINNPSGPSTQVRWRVLSGPNVNRTGLCVRQTVFPGIPTSIWNGSYANQGTVTANNFQDVVQLFLDYDNDGVFDDMANNNTGDLNDPVPGVAIDYGTTFTVNWASITPSVLTKVTITNLLSPSAAVETPSDATFRLTRTGTPTSALEVKICVSGTANGDAGFGDVDYELRVGSTPFQILLISGGETTVTIPAGLTTLDIVLHPINDLLVEGNENVRLALKDVFDVDHSYVVGGFGFAQLDILDNDTPIVRVAAFAATSSEQNPQQPGTWSIDTTTAITQPIKVFFTFGGTASNEVDYLTDLVTGSGIDDTSTSPNILLPSGVGRVTIDPSIPSPLGPTHHTAFVNMNVFQDSRTEGTESVSVTLLPHPSYRIGTPTGVVNITDDDSPKIPANGYTITDLGDSFHTGTTASGINNNLIPQVVGTYLPAGSPGINQAFRWSNGTYTDIAPLLPTPQQSFMVGQAINDGGLVTGSASSLNGGSWVSYYYVSDSLNTLQLQTPSSAPLYTGPRAINDAGWVVGEAMNTGFGVFRAGGWDAVSGNFFDLSGLNPNLNASSFAWALSSSSAGHRVVGESQIEILNGTVTTTSTHGFRTQAGTEPQQVNNSLDDLGNALASETSSSGSRAINSLSEIVGYSAFSATEQRASYKDGNSGKNKGWRTFGVLYGGAGAGLSSMALGLNDSGLAVGWGRSSTGIKAVVWENYQSPAATDLNIKIPVADRPNWVLQYATGINGSGKIVGYGLKNGSQRAFLLIPLP